jgi:hypothetical protein
MNLEEEELPSNNEMPSTGSVGITTTTICTEAKYDFKLI